ncbi:MAG: nuclear transport factor 2 family protein [Candidatus Udaeobacter sp.]
MKPLKGFLASFLAALSIFGASAFSGEIPVLGRDEHTVLGIEHEWLRALVERDRATLDRILAGDFVDSNWKGELHTKSQVLEGLGTARPYLQHLREVKVQLYGSMAVVRGLNEIRDKDGRIVMRIRFTDVLLYRHGSWQAVAAQETPLNPR